MKFNLLTIIFLTLFLFTSSLSSQVIIGSSQTPVGGALLELKENENSDANSSKGLGLPRISLSDLKNLYPMFETTAGSSIANEYYNTDTKKAEEDKKHMGLIAYNITENSQCGLTNGLYVWTGKEWEQLTGEKTSFSGSYASDVEALKELYNNNPGNTLGWDLSGDPTKFDGVMWSNVCGENRITGLVVMEKNLTNSSGLEKLSMLEMLICSNNQFKVLDLSKNLNLKQLSCFDNQLTVLNLSQNSKLTDVWCLNNQLKEIDVSKSKDLVNFNCSNNLLTTLDISNNINLKFLWCSENQLSQEEINKIANNPNYCNEESQMVLTPQYYPNTTTEDSSIQEPACSTK